MNQTAADRAATPAPSPRRSRRTSRQVRVELALLLIIASTGAIASASCTQGEIGKSGAPCDSIYAGQCGKGCAFDAACPAGLYCSAQGACTADCKVGSIACPTGLVCSERGRCDTGDAPASGGGGASSTTTSSSTSSGAGGAGGAVTGSGGAGGVVTGGGGAGGVTTCGDVNVTFVKQPPTVALLLDQTGSMKNTFGNGSRWSVLRDALVDPAAGLVTARQSSMRFGATFFHSDNGSAGGVCPMLTQIPIALNNAAAITAGYPAGPSGDSPTGESLAALTTTLASFTQPGPKSIVLVTDDDPDTCADAHTTDDQPAIDATKAAFSQGIRTYIVGLTDRVSTAFLQDMANAGAGQSGATSNAPYYRALSPQDLTTALQQVLGSIRSCVITLNGSVMPENVSRGHVLVDGQEIPLNGADGWGFSPPNQIELQGAACDALQNPMRVIQVKFPCDAITMN